MELLSFNDHGYGDELLEGALVTIQLSTVAFSFSLLWGVLLGLIALSRNPLAQGFWRIYASFFMGVPTILIVFFLFYNLPFLISAVSSLKIDPSVKPISETNAVSLRSAIQTLVVPGRARRQA